MTASSRLEVHGLGTRKDDDGLIEPSSQLIAITLATYFTLITTSSRPWQVCSGGPSDLLLPGFGLGPSRRRELFDLGDPGRRQACEQIFQINSSPEVKP